MRKWGIRVKIPVDRDRDDAPQLLAGQRRGLQPVRRLRRTGGGFRQQITPDRPVPGFKIRFVLPGTQTLLDQWHALILPMQGQRPGKLNGRDSLARGDEAGRQRRVKGARIGTVAVQNDAARSDRRIGEIGEIRIRHAQTDQQGRTVNVAQRIAGIVGLEQHVQTSVAHAGQQFARSQRLLRSRHHKVEVRTKPLVITVLDFNFEKRTEMDAHLSCSSRPMSVIGSPGMKGSWSWMVTSRAR